MPLSFADHVALLEQHGSAAVAGLSRRSGDDLLPPQDEQAGEVALEHWTTLEIWAWSLEHLDSHWSQREDPTAPTTHADVVHGIAALTRTLVDSLLAHGPDVAVDYFERPGRTADVARLLVHQSIVVAHKAGTGIALSAEVARDALDHTLSHWSTSDAAALDATTWQTQVLAISASDLQQTWWISLPRDTELRMGDFRLVPAQGVGQGQEPSATVRGRAVDLLWWLAGDPIPDEVVSVTGRDADVRALRETFSQPVPTPARRWFGLRSG